MPGFWDSSIPLLVFLHNLRHTTFNVFRGHVAGVDFIGGPALPDCFVCTGVDHRDGYGSFVYGLRIVVLSKVLGRVVDGSPSPGIWIIKRAECGL